MSDNIMQEIAKNWNELGDALRLERNSEIGEDQKTVDNEQAFREWMRQIAKNEGKIDAELDSAGNHDSSYLKHAKEKPEIADIIPCDNLFNIDDAAVINNIKEIIVNERSEFNKNDHYNHSKALNDYYDFLEWKHSAKVEDAAGYSSKQIVEKISGYIKYKGFNYSGKLIENFYLSLKSKPFVILAGISGTGKTRLVKLFAEAIGAGYKLISVRPDWSDSSDLFGHVNLQEHFEPGPLTLAIREAQDNPDKPYFVCLDEMNLARVEYYLSDFLSNIETRRLDNGHIVTDTPIFVIPKHKTENGTDAPEDRLMLPENLYVVGTVNMDETTFPFSKKVLDRANTIEFSEVNLKIGEETPDEQNALINVPKDFLKANYVVLKDCFGQDQNDVLEKWIEQLSNINKELEKKDMHVGYRVRDEICFYLLNNKLADGLLSEDEAFNTEIMQKILPRIQGSDQGIKNILVGIFNKCTYKEETEKYIDPGDDIETIIANVMDSGSDSLLSKKIILMLRRLEDNGNTSFWL